MVKFLCTFMIVYNSGSTSIKKKKKKGKEIVQPKRII